MTWFRVEDSEENWSLLCEEKDNLSSHDIEYFCKSCSAPLEKKEKAIHHRLKGHEITRVVFKIGSEA